MWPLKWKIGALVAALAFTLLLAVLAKPATIGWGIQRVALRVLGMNHAVIQTPGGDEISYFEGGQGPTVILVHGLQDHAGGWMQTVWPLMKAHHVLVMDLPAHGESEPSGYKVDAGDPQRFLGTLIAERVPSGQKVSLVGNSLGGFVVVRYALDHPEQVERVVSVNGAGMPYVADRRMFMPDSTDGMRDTLRRVMGPDALMPPDIMLQDFMREGRRRVPRIWDAIEQTPSFRDELSGLQPELEVIWGMDDGLLSPEFGREMAKLGNGRFYPIENCAHSPQLMCASEFNALLVSILSKDPSTEE